MGAVERPGAGFPDALVEDHDAKFTSEVFRAFVKCRGSLSSARPTTRTHSPR